MELKCVQNLGLIKLPKRRLQVLAAGLYAYLMLFLPILSLLLTIYFVFRFDLIGQIVLVLYLTYIYYDHKKYSSAIYSNGWMILRNNFMTNHLRDYFPIELVKTADLSPHRNYLLASFPHGIIGTGITVNMGNNIGKWLELFPGIRPKIATLDTHFYVPFLREVLRLWGLVSCSKESLICHLSKSNDAKHADNADGFTSNAVAVLVGGAQESLEAHPRRYVLALKKRKGFVKVAIKTGAAIVPTFSFGEVEIFDQVDNPPNSRLRRFQMFVKRLTGVSPLIILGRGFFQYKFGLIPKRHRIVQVVGSPIEVDPSREGDMDYVNEIHQQVMQALQALFNKYKHDYIENADEIQLIIN